MGAFKNSRISIQDDLGICNNTTLYLVDFDDFATFHFVENDDYAILRLTIMRLIPTVASYGITMTWASPEETGTVPSEVRTRRRPRSSTPVAVPSKVAVPAASSMRTSRPVRKDEPS